MLMKTLALLASRLMLGASSLKGRGEKMFEAAGSTVYLTTTLYFPPSEGAGLSCLPQTVPSHAELKTAVA